MASPRQLLLRVSLSSWGPPGWLAGWGPRLGLCVCAQGVDSWGDDRRSLEAHGGSGLGACAAVFLWPPALTTEVAALGVSRGDRAFHVGVGKGGESWLETRRAGARD